jgi:hypothetical protein
MDYPVGFSNQARNRVELEQIEAYDDFDRAALVAPSVSQRVDRLRECVLRIFLAFTTEQCDLAQTSDEHRSIEKVDRGCREFLRLTTIQAWSDKSLDSQSIISNIDRSILPSAARAFETSAKWKTYKDLLKDVGRHSAGDGMGVSGSQKWGATTLNRHKC